MDNTDQLDIPSETHDETPEVVQSPLPEAAKPKREESSPASQEVLVISRVVFNYAIIAVTFLIVGLAIGWIAFGSGKGVEGETVPIDQQMIKDTVKQALEEYNQDSQPETLDTSTIYDVTTEGDPAIGASENDAMVTIVEFSDFRCPYCGRFAVEILPQIVENYGDRVRFVYRDYPIFGNLSIRASLAAECANAQGEFWEYHDLLFANAQALSEEAFVSFAEQLALDMDQFNTCMTDNTYIQEVQDDYNTAAGYGITGTPTFFINGKPMVGAQPYENFAKVIDDAIAAEQQAS